MCTDCQPSQPIYVGNVQSIGTQWCTTSPCGNNSSDAKCTVYKGPNLACTGIFTGNTLEWIVQKFDAAICAAQGDYSGYNTFCLDDINPVTTQQQFVEGISEGFCTLKSDFNTFVSTTFENYKTTVDNRFKDIEVPNITSSTYVGLAPADTHKQIVTKLSNKITDLNSRLDISTVEWSNCFTVDPVPVTIPQALNTINNQICVLLDSIGVGGSAALPTFDNTGSCLANPSTADSLSVTVNKIKTKLCTTPTFNIDALTWTCVTKPTGNNANLQGSFQAILSKLDTISQNMITQTTGDFTTPSVDNAAPCLGKKLTLGTALGIDRYVAVGVSDTAPGTLDTKLQAGTNIGLDFTGTPGKVVINATASLNDKVKSRVADTTAGYLEDKIIGVGTNSGVSTVTSTNTASNKVEITTTVNKSVLFTSLLNQLTSDADLKTLFCDFVQSCLPDCVIPPNVSYIVNPSTPTTSTTTSTTTTIGGGA